MTESTSDSNSTNSSHKNKSTASSPDLKQTNDGSHTLYSHRFNQHYHNPNGAVAESKHNFFETNSLYQALERKDRLTILEIGFGTGLNLLLLADAWLKIDPSARPHIHFCSIEAFPIDKETAARFNYSRFLHHKELEERLTDIFSDLQEEFNAFTLFQNFNLTLFYGYFEAFSCPGLEADFIFHDPFSPEVNEELWTAETFAKLKKHSSPEAVLTTYSAASKAKGAMAYAGWKMAKAPGALGKREMTIASPDPEKLNTFGFKRVNEERLADRYEKGDF